MIVNGYQVGQQMLLSEIKLKTSGTCQLWANGPDR